MPGPPANRTCSHPDRARLDRPRARPPPSRRNPRSPSFDHRIRRLSPASQVARVLKPAERRKPVLGRPHFAARNQVERLLALTLAKPFPSPWRHSSTASPARAGQACAAAAPARWQAFLRKARPHRAARRETATATGRPRWAPSISAARVHGIAELTDGGQALVSSSPGRHLAQQRAIRRDHPLDLFGTPFVAA
jgi:hypothetical protein